MDDAFAGRPRKINREFTPECFGSFVARVCANLPCEAIPRCEEFTRNRRLQGLGLMGTPGSGLSGPGNAQFVQQPQQPQPPPQPQPQIFAPPIPMNPPYPQGYAPQAQQEPQVLVRMRGLLNRPDLIPYVESLGFRRSGVQNDVWEGYSSPQGAGQWGQWGMQYGILLV